MRASDAFPKNCLPMGTTSVFSTLCFYFLVFLLLHHPIMNISFLCTSHCEHSFLSGRIRDGLRGERSASVSTSGSRGLGSSLFERVSLQFGLDITKSQGTDLCPRREYQKYREILLSCEGHFQSSLTKISNACSI